MALEKVSSILKMADEANTSAIAFNCNDYTMAYSVAAVAEELNKPVIIMLYPADSFQKNCCNISGFAATVRELADKVKVPIGLHLDHCSDFDYILNAIKCGFSSVMYDGSMLPVEENIRLTRRVVDAAHALGADVEAELGHVGFAAQSDQHNLDLYTRPEVAAKFCEETKVDSVAVAIGSAHGVYLETPKLDLERLDEINAATDTPLVLHGGSGIPNDQLEQAFRRGINKFNVGTEYFQLYLDSIREFCSQNPDKGSVLDLPMFVQEKLKAYLRVKMQLSRL
ncbi:class II fructose-bisphosphate aldolase [Fusibacillus kribbianus]|uniref:Class II fructose-bisphosphate aldolase n=1 Tax=Fusibacillus kribbianus TaxID=3044208 RepID=A0AAP4BAD6_9FIRM|nr:class II fructose-bisphosphate aldolase [Ruminococcus sp. YH-rum2234]MDI9242956.1 class II fructose-bisphosphate aldolase [Ruminococcus sp. YH-rum2234]